MLRYKIRRTVKKFSLLRFITKPLTYLTLLISAILSTGLSIVAGFLTYSTLLALVPTLLVFFSVLSLLPAFEDLKEGLQNLIFGVISPNSQNTLTEVFDTVIAKTSSLSIPSVISLFVIAFMLVRTIDSTINKNIWRIRKRRKLLSSFTLY